MSDDHATGPVAADSGFDLRTVWPFLAALTVIVLVIIGVVLFEMLAPTGRNLTDSDRVAIAVRDFVAAHNNGNDAAKKKTECPGFDEAHSRFTAAARTLDPTKFTVEHVTVNGDHATADVVQDAKTTHWTLARPGDTWVVCG